MNRTIAFPFTLRAFAAWLAVAMLLALSPAVLAKKVLQDSGGADPEIEERIDEARDELADAPSALNTTIRGSVFYNDRRTHGLFGDRRDRDDTPGLQCNKRAAVKPECGSISKRLAELREQRRGQADLIDDFEGGSIAVLEEQLKRIDADIAIEESNLDQCQGCGANWLAGKYMVVDVLDAKCGKTEPLASATVGSNGSFTAVVPASAACNAVRLRARLRFCNSSYCFSINEKDDDPYALYHPAASASRPLTVKPGDDITLAPLLFNTADNAGVPNNVSIAANYYASIVDTILMLHKTNPIPFFRSEFDELQYIFPSTESDTATAQSPNRIVISSYESRPADAKGGYAWVPGDTPAHEYGHVLMQRAWGGDYGFKGVGITAHDYEKTSRQLAFKEAWAEFIKRAVFKDSLGCHRAGFDANGEIELDCSAIARNLTALREQRQDQRELLNAMSHHQGPGYQAAKEQLKRLDAQIAADEKRLADCRAHPTAVNYSNSKTYADDSLSDTDQNLKGPLDEGAEWRDNIIKALCDWYDSSDDDDRNLAGPGDHFAGDDIHSVWSNLRNMYLDADKYGGEFRNPGLWFCDYVRYYLDVRKSAAAVGATEHASYEQSIRDLIYNNNIACSMPSPD